MSARRDNGGEAELPDAGRPMQHGEEASAMRNDRERRKRHAEDHQNGAAEVHAMGDAVAQSSGKRSRGAQDEERAKESDGMDGVGTGEQRKPSHQQQEHAKGHAEESAEGHAHESMARTKERGDPDGDGPAAPPPPPPPPPPASGSPPRSRPQREGHEDRARHERQDRPDDRRRDRQQQHQQQQQQRQKGDMRGPGQPREAVRSERDWRGDGGGAEPYGRRAAWESERQGRRPDRGGRSPDRPRARRGSPVYDAPDSSEPGGGRARVESPGPGRREARLRPGEEGFEDRALDGRSNERGGGVRDKDWSRERRGGAPEQERSRERGGGPEQERSRERGGGLEQERSRERGGGPEQERSRERHAGGIEQDQSRERRREEPGSVPRGIVREMRDAWSRERGTGAGGERRQGDDRRQGGGGPQGPLGRGRDGTGREGRREPAGRGRDGPLPDGLARDAGDRGMGQDGREPPGGRDDWSRERGGRADRGDVDRYGPERAEREGGRAAHGGRHEEDRPGRREGGAVRCDEGRLGWEGGEQGQADRRRGQEGRAHGDGYGNGRDVEQGPGQEQGRQQQGPRGGAGGRGGRDNRGGRDDWGGRDSAGGRDTMVPDNRGGPDDWRRDDRRQGNRQRGGQREPRGPRPAFAHDPSVPEAGSEGVNSADIVRAMMGLPPLSGSQGPASSGVQGPRPPPGAPPGDAAAAAAAAAAVAASLVANAQHKHHHHHHKQHGGGGHGHEPAPGSGMTREEKLQKLWGPKKAEAGEAVVQALSSQAKVDASTVFGHNRWDAAEFQSEAERERFQRLMGINKEVASVVAPLTDTDPEALGGHKAMSREEQAKVLHDVEEAFIAGLRHTGAKTAGLGAEVPP